ncbi:hypothetical protein [Dyella japonica]|uniref:Uncharacterized protein n=1 Tax=Dyella japonica A8 TaxID=1217721 RepID=A0A075JV26_9GAMM|nr:hypothetical protein [Dyella japonica]AIF45961.1 hypothetical protein HY57_01105 [Dyella japonica A8]
MFVAIRCGLVLALALLATCVLASESDALTRLQRTSSGHIWDRDSVLKIDIDSDGKPDYVFLSQDSKSASVGLVLGQRGRRVIVHTFPIGDPSQDSLCAAPAGIAKESLDYDPTDEVGAISGFRRSKAGTAFILGEGECDLFHFFWNTKTNNLDWWRL